VKTIAFVGNRFSDCVLFSFHNEIPFMIELHLYNYFIISFFGGEHKVYGRLSHGGGRLYSCTQEGSGAFGAQVQAAIGLTPLAAPVPPTERAGSEGVM
jgi:hypothetical protein